MSYELSAIISIGLEKQVLSEFNLKKKYYFKDLSIKTSIFSGGILFSFEDMRCFHLIKVLRSPTKFFLKIAEFKSRDLPKIFNQISKFPWENYLYSSDFQVTATSKKSRLINTKKIEETAEKALRKWLSANPRKNLPLSLYTKTQKIHLSFNDDILSIRLDCSGEPNFKRNLRETQGLAPLRENYAYIMISLLTKNLEKADEKTVIVDPMCGSATIFSEANNFFESITERDFSYQYFYILKNLAPLNSRPIKENAFSLLGIEKNQYLQAFHQQNFSTQKNVKFLYQDFLQLKKEDILHEKQIFISNLPYGKRIKIAGDIVEFYRDVIKKIKNDFPNSISGFLMPTNFANKLHLKKLVSFKNGGLSVSFCQVNSSFNTDSTRVRD
jgi:putative N6-adenine-specific DNA methylase